MKKLLSLTLLAGMFAFSACGPSAEEQAEQNRLAQDSIALADSMMRAAEQQAVEVAKADSMTAPADSAAMPDTTHH